jgi:hypothetical protein
LKKDGLLKYLEMAHQAPEDSLMTKSIFQLFGKFFDNNKSHQVDEFTEIWRSVKP